MQRNRSITTDLYLIIKNITRGYHWSAIFDAHCTRLGKTRLSSDRVNYHYDPNAYGFQYWCTATWRKRTYIGASCPSRYQARDDLFRKIMQAVIIKELNKSTIMVVSAPEE